MNQPKHDHPPQSVPVVADTFVNQVHPEHGVHPQHEVPSFDSTLDVELFAEEKVLVIGFLQTVHQAGQSLISLDLIPRFIRFGRRLWPLRVMPFGIFVQHRVEEPGYERFEVGSLKMCWPLEARRSEVSLVFEYSICKSSVQAEFALVEARGPDEPSADEFRVASEQAMTERRCLMERRTDETRALRKLRLHSDEFAVESGAIESHATRECSAQKEVNQTRKSGAVESGEPDEHELFEANKIGEVDV